MFLIDNAGTGDLDLSTPISIIEGDIFDFSIDDSLIPTSLIPGDTTFFDITFAPTSQGNKSVTIEIPNNDPDENPYIFTVVGKSSLSDEPEINALVGSNEYLNGSTYNFGTINLGNSVSATFTIQNLGTSDLFITSILFITGQAGDFSHDLAIPLIVPVGDEKDFTVKFTPTDFGIRTTRLQIQSNDFDEDPYKVTLRGTGM
jgi:hypothetical protein